MPYRQRHAIYKQVKGRQEPNRERSILIKDGWIAIFIKHYLILGQRETKV
jgi:hypothetical protein